MAKLPPRLSPADLQSRWVAQMERHLTHHLGYVKSFIKYLEEKLVRSSVQGSTAVQDLALHVAKGLRRYEDHLEKVCTRRNWHTYQSMLANWRPIALSLPEPPVFPTRVSVLGPSGNEHLEVMLTDTDDLRATRKFIYSVSKLCVQLQLAEQDFLRVSNNPNVYSVHDSEYHLLSGNNSDHAPTGLWDGEGDAVSPEMPGNPMVMASGSRRSISEGRSFPSEKLQGGEPMPVCQAAVHVSRSATTWPSTSPKSNPAGNAAAQSTNDLTTPGGPGRNEHPDARKRIRLLREYNDIRDIGQQLIGLIADNHGSSIGALYRDGRFGVTPDD